MKIFTMFEPRTSKKDTSHFRQLIALAKTDGLISESELELLYSIGAKNNFKTEEIDELLNDNSPLNLVIPSNDSDRFDQIFDMVQMMLADGVIDETEIDFCINLADKLGFRKAIIGVLVRKISMNISSGSDKEKIKEEAKSFLKF
ncbi:MAG TPA: TerB family tellurite resistance protein [Cytophagaceae bacterium]